MMARQAFIWPSCRGKHFVIYDDGGRTGCMAKSIARDYAGMFGGTVHRHPDYPTVWDRVRALARRLT